MPIWDLEMGYASLNHLEPGAAVLPGRFSSGSKDVLCQDALLKLSWFYLSERRPARADSFRMLIQPQGEYGSRCDRQAVKEARAGMAQ